MRHKRRIYRKGDRRIKTWFAWLPTWCPSNGTGIQETRWLEQVTVEQEYYESITPFSLCRASWDNVRFIDSKLEEDNARKD